MLPPRPASPLLIPSSPSPFPSEQPLSAGGGRAAGPGWRPLLSALPASLPRAGTQRRPLRARLAARGAGLPGLISLGERCRSLELWGGSTSRGAGTRAASFSPECPHAHLPKCGK